MQDQDRDSTRTLENLDTRFTEPQTSRKQRRQAKKMAKLFNKIQNREAVKKDLCLKYDGKKERWVK